MKEVFKMLLILGVAALTLTSMVFLFEIIVKATVKSMLGF